MQLSLVTYDRYVLLIFLFYIILAFSSCGESMTQSPTEPDPDTNQEVTVQNDIVGLDNSVLSFMDEYNIPGASLSVSKNEKLVYQKGYGFANTETSQEVSPDNVFRIASISKMFTATAIFKLVEDGSLNLSDKVFGDNGILGDDFTNNPLDDRIYDLTIDNLLFNTSGGWGVASGGDPIDFEPTFNHNNFIEYVLEEWELNHDPGDAFVYSNTGYYLLARIIEEISNMDFDQFLKNEVLSSTGQTSFHITNFDKDDRRNNEVEYYGQNEDNQYVYSIADRRDGDAGAVISSNDLLRVVTGIDGFSNRPDILSSSTLSLMTEATPKQPNWARGIGVWPQQSVMYMTGSLPGTRTWLMIGENGISVVLLLNSRSNLQNFDNDFQNLLLDIVKNSNYNWQDNFDQF